MGISPIAIGDGRPSHHTLTTDSGIFPLTGLANNTLALHLEDMNNNNTLYICTGAWSITGDGSAGKADFTPSSTDLLATNPFGKGGVFKAYPVVTLSTGPVAMDSQILAIVSLP